MRESLRARSRASARVPGERAARHATPPVAGLLELQRVAGNTALQRATRDGGRSPVLDVVGHGGSPLTPDVREDMEARLGADFSDVRVHTDGTATSSAAAVGAHAYTVGHDVVFGAGRFDTRSDAGRTVLAHELTHVIQQRTGPVAGTPTGDGISVSDPSDRFEREAEANAVRVMRTPVATASRAASRAAPSSPTRPAGRRARPVQRMTADSMKGTVDTFAALDTALARAGYPKLDLTELATRTRLGLGAVPSTQAPATGPPPPPGTPGASRPPLVTDEQMARLDAAVQRSDYHVRTGANAELVRHEVLRELAGGGPVTPPAIERSEPKVGVELETNAITIECDAPLTPAQRELVKGARIVLDDTAASKKHEGEEWAATVELSGRGYILEVIVLGRQGRGMTIGDPSTFAARLTAVGTQVASYVGDLVAGTPIKVDLAPGQQTANNQPDVTAVEAARWKLGSVGTAAMFAIQVTVPMPLAALADYAVSAGKYTHLHKGGVSPANDDDRQRQSTIRVAPEHLPAWARAQGTPVDALRGFLGLVFTYARRSNAPGTGLKHQSPVMPRTDFAAMLGMVLAAGLGPAADQAARDEKRTPNDVLMDLFVTTYKNVTEREFLDQSVYWEQRELRMADWVTALIVDREDLIRRIDKESRHGQIGGLGPRTETVVGADAPIVEFRDAGSVPLADIAEKLGKIGTEVLARQGAT